jgi:hypothetical protein
MFVAAVQKQI